MYDTLGKCVGVWPGSEEHAFPFLSGGHNTEFLRITRYKYSPGSVTPISPDSIQRGNPQSSLQTGSYGDENYN